MPNQHAVALTAPLAIAGTAEQVVLSLTAFTENQSPSGSASNAIVGTQGAQGVVLDANMNLVVTAGGLVTARLRYGSLTGAVVAGFLPSTGQVVTAGVNLATNVAAWCLDPTLLEVGVVYVLTIASAGGVGTINSAVLTAMDATAFE